VSAKEMVKNAKYIWANNTNFALKN
jgi:hypothetical protein